MRIMVVLLVVVLIIICSAIVIFPPSKGLVPALRDENGNVIEGSIAEKCYVDIDGCSIGMFILTENIDNPVLLVCGGGPGIPEYLMEYMYPLELPKYFTVCYPDYRGTGLSYSGKIDTKDITTERYVLDAVKITEYLSERFNQDKIYIMGHSFGTYVAAKTVQEYPQYYNAYIAMSQTCRQRESEYMAFDYMKSQYELQGNKKMVKKFEECPIRESDEMYEKYFSSSLRDTAMHELGVGTTRDMDSVITGIFLPSLKCKSYTWKERINIWRGKIESRQFNVCNDTIHFDAYEEIPSLQIPVYFFAGKYDYTCNYDLQYEYYTKLKAPKKAFYEFDKSAHSPIYEEPERAKEIFEDILGDVDMNYMKIAIEEAREGIKNKDGGPFGCVIVKDGAIVGRGHNRVLLNKDATCHGEMEAIRDASKNLNTHDLSGAILYTTAAPCPMCKGAILWANIDKVYFGCTVEDTDAIGFRDEIFYSKWAESGDNFGEELERDECLKLFEDYSSSEHNIY